MNLQEILPYFQGVKNMGNNQYMAKCPCHDDRTPSMSITEKDGKVLIGYESELTRNNGKVQRLRLLPKFIHLKH